MMETRVQDTLSKLKESLESAEPQQINPDPALDTLVAEIKILSRQTVGNIIEIGRRLIEAKKLVGHGNWEAWLAAEIDYSPVTAWRFMQAAEVFGNIPAGNLSALKDFSQTKIFALLEVPVSDREEFVAQTHDVGGQQKTVDEMTSRELAQAIKALKDAERDKAAKDSEIQRQAQKLQKLESDLEQSMIAQKMLADLKKPETVTVEKKVEVAPPDYERTKKQLQEAMDNVASLKARLDSYKAAGENRDETMMRIEFFTHNINRFVRENATLGYFGNIYAKASPTAQREYDKSLTMLEKWCRDMRDQAIIPKSEEVYEMEAG